ncbi:MAG TPA: right-handed parallel beta-helix repeat-containing protein, partial [Spirochaetia bacterium]|nr:right-handed parallel beta-helix repeat-containing protein [Spirochaetia bacterium]
MIWLARARIAVLLAASFALVQCAGVPPRLVSYRTESASAAFAARMASIVSGWEAGGGSRAHPPSERALAIGAGTVSAAWWGFDPTDATSALQAAVDSGAATVVIPLMPGPWIISRTLTIRRGQVEILLEPGVVLLAKKGAFRDGGDCLIRAEGATDFSILGYGATLRMRKSDYRKRPYERAEWRHGISLRGAARARIAGLRIEGAGGDGIYVGVLRRQAVHLPCEDLILQDLEISDSCRQGVSVTSARHLLIQDCWISGSSGALPMSGIDFEPNGGDPGFSDCVVRGCRIEGNSGVGVLCVLSNLGPDAEPVAIRIQECVVDNLTVAIWLRGLDNHVRGTLTFAGNTVRGLRFLRGSS